jgi:anion-transporting  ArsA/GET3 family ATPase
VRERADRILYLTGKGGAGKTFVSGLVAEAAVRRGLRPILVRFEGEGDPLTGSPVQPIAGMSCVVLDQQKALAQVLTKLVRLERLSARLMDSRTFTAIAAAAPGLRDVIFLVAIRDLAERAGAEGRGPVIVDGFACGHSALLLGAPGRVERLVRIGRLAREVAAAAALVREAERFRVAVVSGPEELAIVETEEMLAELRALGITLGPVLVNGVLPRRAQAADEQWLEGHGGSEDSRWYIRRRRRQVLVAARLGDVSSEVLEVPYRFPGDSPPAPDPADVLLDGLLRAQA